MYEDAWQKKREAEKDALIRELKAKLEALQAEHKALDLAVSGADHAASRAGLDVGDDPVAYFIDTLADERDILRQKLTDLEARIGGAPLDGGMQVEHYKGGIYRIVCGRARIEATKEDVVVYRSQADGTVWVRPGSEFWGFVEVDGEQVLRFGAVGG